MLKKEICVLSHYGMSTWPSVSNLKLNIVFSWGIMQVAKQLKEQQMVMRGHRETSMVHELNR